MSASASNLGAYTQIDVETASQGKLVIMLFNGAIKRAEEARRQLEKNSCEGVHNNLIRAQDILGELRTSLDMKAGPISQNLDRLYEYFQHLLIQANIKKDAEPIIECIRMMSDMRDTWTEAFATAEKDKPTKQPPKINQHGESLLNLQG